MSAQSDIYYVHRGPVPKYLIYSIENTRAFNPHARIFLIGDKISRAINRLGVNFIPFQDLPQDDHNEFQRSYIHTSVNPEPFERFCFSRWFYLNHAMAVNKSEIAIHLDSDCMIFDSVDSLVQRLLSPEFECYYGQGSAPHVAIFRKAGIANLIKTLLSLFNSDFYLDFSKSNWRELRHGFSDMAGLNYHHMQNSHEINSQIIWSDGIIEQTISVSHGFEIWPGAKSLKKVRWEFENGKLVPYLKDVAKQKWIRAFALHYKGSCKRRMKLFNRKGRPLPAQVLARYYFNHVPPINLWERIKRAFLV